MYGSIMCFIGSDEMGLIRSLLLLTYYKKVPYFRSEQLCVYLKIVKSLLVQTLPCFQS